MRQNVPFLNQPVMQEGFSLIIKLVILLAALILIGLAVITVCYRKIGPGEVFVIYGGEKNIKPISGPRGYFFIPLFHAYRVLSLEPFTITLKIPGVLILDGVSLELEGMARLKLKDDFYSIRKAAQTMLNKSQREKESVLTSIIDEASRKTLRNIEPERLVSDTEGCIAEIIGESASNLDNLGYELQIITFSQISDKLGYINTLIRRVAAEKKARMAIEEAYISREGITISSMIKRDTQIQRIGQSLEDRAKPNLDMNKVMQQTDEFFRGLKDRLEKGIQGVSKNLYTSEGPEPPEESEPSEEPGPSEEPAPWEPKENL